jgi:hypothetical protein
MIDPPIHEILLPLWLRLISCSRSCRPGGALPCEMASQTTLEISSTSMASLSWCTLRGWSIRAGVLLHVLAIAVAACWVEVVDVETSTSGSSGIVFENSVAASEAEGATLALASVADSSLVI